MRLRVYGIVQGVGFRPTVVRVAREMGLNGHVRNEGSNVEIILDGDADDFVERLKRALPALARIDRVDKSQAEPEGKGFVILASGDGQRSSGLPPDTAVCAECLREMRSKADRRFEYPFTTCTACGERFSVVYDLPYDRARTAMSDFKMCQACESEYGTQADRRFHHQTIACPECGPKYALYDSKGVEIHGGAARFAELLDSGAFCVLKGWGGSHLCSAMGVAPKFRKWYMREAKPFAIMARNLEAAKDLFEVTAAEEEELKSPQRPIVLLTKRQGTPVMDAISPGLESVGVMLPYSGIHHIIFQHLKSEALIMTSANPAGAPMYLEEKDMFGLGAEYYLLHNRRIANRCDDSVLKMFGSSRFLIRRSRGFVPRSINVGIEGIVLGAGPGENVTSCVSKEGSLTPSQYIGDTENYDVLEYHRGAIQQLIRLRGIQHFDAVAVDLHPRYPTRRVGEEIADEHKAKLVEVQHHWAHALSLMAEHKLPSIVALSLDGTGYGDDGMSWGGEVIASATAEYRRAGHLEYVPLPGSDEAVKDPSRILFAIEELCGVESRRFEERDAEVLRKLIPKSIRTSSAGRVLDALSFYVGACSKWTYDGEPAMRLEPMLSKGKPVYEFEVEVEGGVVETLPLFERLFEMAPRGASERCNAASSFVEAMVRGLVTVANEAADKEGSDAIGLTGGVSYSLPLARMFEAEVIKAGKRPVFHHELPNGDGGISAGQCLAALGALE